MIRDHGVSLVPVPSLRLVSGEGLLLFRVQFVQAYLVRLDVLQEALLRGGYTCHLMHGYLLLRLILIVLLHHGLRGHFLVIKVPRTG